MTRELANGRAHLASVADHGVRMVLAGAQSVAEAFAGFHAEVARYAALIASYAFTLPLLSRGNLKLGHTPNWAFPPVLTCDDCVTGDKPCARWCYALSAWQMYPRVREQWTWNFALALLHPDLWLTGMTLELKRKHARYVRGLVAGSVFSVRNALDTIRLARALPGKAFLLYATTTSREYLRIASLELPVPRNLSVVWSRGAGLFDNTVPVPQARVAWQLEHQVGFMCPGSCRQCRACWHAHGTARVVFKPHGGRSMTRVLRDTFGPRP